MMHYAHKLLGHLVMALAVIICASRLVGAQTLTIQVNPSSTEVYLPIGTGGQYSFSSQVTAGLPTCTGQECTNVTTYSWSASSPGQVPKNTNASGVTVTIPTTTPAGDYTITVGCSEKVVIGSCGTCTGTYSGNGSATLIVHIIAVTGISVVSGATQSNVNQNVTIGTTSYLNNYACVKSSTNAIFSATVTPSGEAPAKISSLITWSSGSPVSGSPLEYQFSTNTSTVTQITVTCGTSSAQADLWVIWGTTSTAITGSLNSNDQAATLYQGPSRGWYPTVGGGTSLGAISHCQVPSLTYAYTVGKYETTATLTPAGIGKIIAPSAWAMNRFVTDIAFDNGAVSSQRTNSSDTGESDNLYTSTTTDQLFAVDAPGCSNTLPGITIDHTAEVYLNFTGWASVNLGSAQDVTTLCVNIE